MGSKAPPVPPDQRSHRVRGASSPSDRHAEITHDPAGGNAGLNLKEQGRYGAIRQTAVHQGRAGDR